MPIAGANLTAPMVHSLNAVRIDRTPRPIRIKDIVRLSPAAKRQFRFGSQCVSVLNRRCFTRLPGTRRDCALRAAELSPNWRNTIASAPRIGLTTQRSQQISYDQSVCDYQNRPRKGKSQRNRKSRLAAACKSVYRQTEKADLIARDQNAFLTLVAGLLSPAQNDAKSHLPPICQFLLD